MNKKGHFTFGGKYSKDYNIVLTKVPPRILAERDVESLSVAGRSGDLTCDGGRYKNVLIPYSCAITPQKGLDLNESLFMAVNMQISSAQYDRLENSFEPDVYRIARISKSISIASAAEKAGTFTITFDCKPQRFLISGETPFEYLMPSFIVNPTQFAAKPVIEVFGTGPGTVTVGNATVEIKALEDQVTLDCDIQNAYRQVGESAPENKNACIYAPEFPELLPGENIVNWDGGITSVKITPRWWTL